MADLLLVRHGETALNASGRYQGWLDPGLSDAGRRQALEAGRVVQEAGLRPAMVWSSDLRRARETTLLAFSGLPVRADRRLRELHFGAWEGWTWEEARREHPEAFDAWCRDPEVVPPPGGETLAELRDRLDHWWHESASWARGTDGTLAVVAHAGPLRVLLARLLALPPAWRWESMLRIRRGAVVRAGPWPWLRPGASPLFGPGARTERAGRAGSPA
ncbi:MAG TPA: histidine phosphatase family protein [Longimicrobiales bacterium]|nr:histidine phosphatase family protein [Longimicrobiales bacterium]